MGISNFTFTFVSLSVVVVTAAVSMVDCDGFESSSMINGDDKGIVSGGDKSGAVWLGFVIETLENAGIFGAALVVDIGFGFVGVELKN